MKDMNTNERGVAIGAMVVVIALLGIAGVALLGFYIYKNPIRTGEGKREVAYVATTTTTYEATTTTTTNTPIVKIPKPLDTRAYTPYPAGPYYHSSTYGLTVPGSFTVTANSAEATYGGVRPTASYNFYFADNYAFTINVFSKEQWNNIRIQETLKADGGETNAYFGEGIYLGENMTWIFSFVPVSYTTPPQGILFY